MKVLIANRGEIACRILRTCRERKIESVAVYSDPDEGAPHTKLASEAVRIGGGEAAQSYLNIEAIVAAAKNTGADAVHPGYGFLSENGDFAAALQKEGILFIGPSPETLKRCGDKLAAKEAAALAGLPLIPDLRLGEAFDEKAVSAFGAKHGFPILIKAGSGGGGRGMRVVQSAKECKAAVEAARKEALAFFGDGSLFIERYLNPVRHVEIQGARDSSGNIYCLGERDCSLQRRHQKIIEEAPSPFVSKALRKKLYEFSSALFEEIDYLNVGTIEFLLDSAGKPYFIEVNPRIQVEHPVTEEVFGIDLVDLQIELASGGSLPEQLGGKERFLEPERYAIEARIYAEDPLSGFQPSSGLIRSWAPPEKIEVRVESGISSGSTVPRFYDPMLAKLICSASSREEVIELLRDSLARTRVIGLKHNIGLLHTLLSLEQFRIAQHHTQTIADSGLLEADANEYRQGVAQEVLKSASLPTRSSDSPWHSRSRFRIAPLSNARSLRIDGTVIQVESDTELQEERIVSLWEDL